MAILQTKKQNGGGYVNSYTVAMASNVTAGSTLKLFLTAGSANTISSITDNRSNTWTLAVSEVGTDRTTWHYYVKNANAGATTVTITFTSGQFADSCVFIREYDGEDTTAPLDQTASADDGTSFLQTHSCGTTGTTTQASEVVVCAVGSSGSSDPVFAAGTGYGNLSQQNGFDAFTYAAIQDKTVSSTGTQTGNMTTTGFVRGQGIIATYKTAAAAATTVHRFLLTGVGI